MKKKRPQFGKTLEGKNDVVEQQMDKCKSILGKSIKKMRAAGERAAKMPCMRHKSELEVVKAAEPLKAINNLKSLIA